MPSSSDTKRWVPMLILVAVLCVLLWVLVLSRGRAAAILFSLPHGLPETVIVHDAETGKPLPGALVRAEWWCHDNPLPDAPGSFFVTSETVTDEDGRAAPTLPDDRGGWFGCSLAVTISKPGYVPAGVLVDPSNFPLPESEASWPFRATTVVPRVPETLEVSLAPALPVYLAALFNDDPLVRTVAAEELSGLPVTGAERGTVIRALTDALDDPDEQVREAAARALKVMDRIDN